MPKPIDKVGISDIFYEVLERRDILLTTKVQSARLIDMKGIYKNFGGADVLSNINLYIRKNEFVTLLGPSGCGKTTTLRIIGGFETPTRGELLFEGVDILKLPPHKRRVNTVFQEYALFSHMNVGENIAFGPSIKKIDKEIIKAKVADMLKLVNLPGYEKRSIQSLSGGQQQRVAIARALANEPVALLLDEPFGALDLKMREEMRIELKNMQRELGITFIHVTHDQEEALTMSDTIIVMNNGVIQQIGTPIDVYNEPENVFVARFIGQSNILKGHMIADFKVEFLRREFDCLDSGFSPNEEVDVVIRPEDIRITSEDDGHLKGIVKDVTFTGSHYIMYIETNAGTSDGAHAGAYAGANAGAYAGANAGAYAGANAGANAGAYAGANAGANAGAYAGVNAVCKPETNVAARIGSENERERYTWNALSIDMSPVGSVVGIEIIPDAIHVMKKSAPEGKKPTPFASSPKVGNVDGASFAKRRRASSS